MRSPTLFVLAGVFLLGCPPTDTYTPTSTDLPTEPTPTPIPPFAWTVALEDADGIPDTGFDPDLTVVSTENAVANFPDLVTFEFGFAQTGAGGDSGWFGEDCDGLVSNGQEICHPLVPDSTLSLTRVETVSEIEPGSTTYNYVNFPVDRTVGLTFVIFGYDEANDLVDCWTQGDSPSYYPDCVTYRPPM